MFRPLFLRVSFILFKHEKVKLQLCHSILLTSICDNRYRDNHTVWKDFLLNILSLLLIQKERIPWDYNTNIELQKKLSENGLTLTKQMKLFNETYTSYISPWTSTSTKLELYNTGSVVRKVSQQLDQIEKVILYIMNNLYFNFSS